MALVKIGNQYINVDKIESVAVSPVRIHERARIAVCLEAGRIVGEDIPDGVEPEAHLRAVAQRINLNA